MIEEIWGAVKAHRQRPYPRLRDGEEEVEAVYCGG